MTKITHSELIEDNIFQPTIQEALQLVKALEQVQQGFKGIAAEANNKMQKNTLGSSEEIAAFNVETQKAIIASKEFEKATKDRITAEERLKQAIQGETDETMQLRYELKKINAEKRKEIQASDASLGSYQRASMQLSKLRQSYKDLAIEGRHNTDVARKMKLEIDKLNSTILDVDASVGQYQRNVGNYASGFNALGNSINQLTREAPAFANSMQTGFMAISNNLPIMFDAYGDIIKQNKILQAQGVKTQSAISQLGKAFFSWGTALSLGVTLLTVFGAKMVDFVSELFDGTTAIKEYEKAIKEVNIATSDESNKIQILTNVIKENTNWERDRQSALNELKQIIPQLSAVELQHADAIQVVTFWSGKYIEAQIAKIKADKIIEKITELQNKRAEEEAKTTKERMTLLDNLTVTMGGSWRAHKRYIDERERSIQVEKMLEKEAQELLLKSLQLGEEVVVKKSNLSEKSIAQAKKERDIYEALEKSKIALIEDENERKVQSLRLERDLSVKKIQTEYSASKQRDELVENTKKNYNRQILELSQIDLTRENSAQQHQAKLNEIESQGIYKRKELNQIAAKRVTRTLNALETAQKNSVERRLELIDREIEVSRDRAQTLTALAAQGQQDAKDSIAVEEKQQAELQAKREQIIRRQKRDEFLLSGIKTYAAKVEKGDPNPVGSTIRDLTAISAAIRSLPAFYEGAENVGNSLGKPQIKGKDGYIVRVDGSERVLTGKQNAMIGSMSNDELADLAHKYRFNKIEPIKIENKQADNRHWGAMLAELTVLRQTVANKPENTFDYDKVADMVIERVKKGNAVEVKLRKNTL